MKNFIENRVCKINEFLTQEIPFHPVSVYFFVRRDDAGFQGWRDEKTEFKDFASLENKFKPDLNIMRSLAEENKEAFEENFYFDEGYYPKVDIDQFQPSELQLLSVQEYWKSDFSLVKFCEGDMNDAFADISICSKMDPARVYFLNALSNALLLNFWIYADYRDWPMQTEGGFYKLFFL